MANESKVARLLDQPGRTPSLVIDLVDAVTVDDDGDDALLALDLSRKTDLWNRWRHLRSGMGWRSDGSQSSSGRIDFCLS
jgi:hypothetical protein